MAYFLSLYYCKSLGQDTTAISVALPASVYKLNDFGCDFVGVLFSHPNIWLVPTDWCGGPSPHPYLGL